MAIAKVKRVVERAKVANTKVDPIVDSVLHKTASSKYTIIVVILAFIASACLGAWLHSLVC
jgi:nitrogen regulatory protein PII-like uncharacterized protein